MVEKGGIHVMPDRADDRGCRFGDRADQGLVAERQQVFDRPAAAGDDDDLDVTEGVEVGQGAADVPDGGAALNRDGPDLEPDRRPPAAGVLDDISLGRAAPAADEADGVGKERQRTLAVGVEEALGPQRRLEVLEAGEEFADSHRTDLPGVQHQRAALVPECGLGLEDHPLAGGQGARHGGESVDGDRDGQGHVDVGVAEREIGGLGAGPLGQLDDLSLDPQDRHLVHIVPDLEAQKPDRPRSFRGRVGRAIGQLGRGH